jgi:hypothetical protein
MKSVLEEAERWLQEALEPDPPDKNSEEDDDDEDH